MKRPWLYLAIAAAEIGLLALYFSRTGVWMGARTFFVSFVFPQHGRFIPTRLILVWAMSLSSALVAGVWLVIAAGAGAAALSALKVRAPTMLQNALIALGLGLGALSLALFFMAEARILTRPAVLALGIILAAPGAVILRRGSVPAPGRSSRADLNPTLAAALALAAVLLLFHACGALLPPSGFDEMDYQLSLPKLYAINGGFVPTPFSHFSFMPRNVNMLFLLGLLSGGAGVAKIFALALGLLAALALYAFAQPHLGTRAALLAALTFFFTPVIGNQFRVATPDLSTAFFELLGIGLLLRWRQERGDRLLLLAGVFWGIALGCKYTAFPDLAAASLALSWLCRKDGRRSVLRSLSVFGSTAALLVSPWLVKNWLASGNPFNPLFSTVIKSSNFYFAGAYKPTVDYARGVGIEDYFPIHGLRDLLFLPWRIVVRHNDYNHDLGPVWLLLAPLGLLSLRRRAPAWLKSALVFAASCWLFWLCGSIHMTRYFTAGLALACLPAGWLLHAAFEPSPWGWALVFPVLLAWFQQSARMIEIQNETKRPWGYFSGRSSLADYLTGVQVDCPYDAIEFINNTAPKDARVLVFNEFRTFYLERDFLASTPWDHDYWLEMIRQSATPEELLARLKARGVTHFLCNDSLRWHQTGMPRSEEWTPADLANEKRLLLHVMKQLYRGGEGAWVAVVRDKVHYW